MQNNRNNRNNRNSNSHSNGAGAVGAPAPSDAPIVLRVGDALTPEILERVKACMAITPASRFGTAQGVLLLEGFGHVFDALRSRSVCEFDRWGEWQADEAKSTVHWLSAEAHLSPSEARTQLARGKTAEELPSFGEAWKQGTITGGHLDLVDKICTPGLEAALVRDQEELLALAQEKSTPEFGRDLGRWAIEVGPKEAEDKFLAQCERRAASFGPGADGTFWGSARLDPIGGQVVSSELERRYDELFEADWAEATARLGHEPTVGDLQRTPAQRWADALVEMARRSGAMPKGARKPAPLFSVLVGYESLRGAICHLEQSRIPLPAGSLLPFFEEADFERAVFAPGARIEVSHKARLFSGATRRAIELRDQGCTHPGCNEPVQRTEAHHIVAYAQGGPTTQENATLLCRYHHACEDRRPPPDG